MSESGRKQNSKWDITEVDMSPEDLHNSARRIKKGSSFHDKDVGWHSSNDHGNNDPSNIAKHDIGMQFRESLSGRRDFQRDESINEKSMLSWDGDGNYTTRMSPGLDDWRQQKRHHSRSRSPKSRARSRRSRSRSRSRSPARKFRRELGSNDQSRRNRSGVSSQSCRDFSSGRCRRGNSCPFLHHESQDYDRRHLESGSIDGLESRLRKNGGSRHSSDDPRDYPLSGRSKHSCNDFLKGKCNRGASCKFAHNDNVSNVVGKGPARDVYRDRDPSKSRGPLCKFFSAGNCHDGKHCRFSHHRRETESPETRLLNEISTRLPDHDLDNVSRSRNGSKWSDVDTITEQVENVDVMKPRNTAWSGEDPANHNFVTKSHTSGAPTSWDAPVSIDEKQLFQWKPENIIPDAVVSDMKGVQKCFSDTELLSSNSIVQQQAGKIIRNPESVFLPQASCPSGQRDMPREVPSDKQYAAGFVQPQIFDNSFFQQKSTFGGDFSPLYPVENLNASGKTPSSHANLNVSTDVFPGHGIDPIFGSQPMSGFHLYPATRLLPPGEGLKMSHNQSVLDNSLTDGMDIGCANSSQSAPAAAPARSVVLDDPLSQASHLSSIAQLLENRQQLSQLYAGVSSLLDSMASVPPASTAAFQAANEADGSKHYDPICDSIEQKTPTANTQSFPNVVDQKLSVHGTLPSPTSAAVPTPSVTGILDSGDLLKAGLPRDELNQQGPVHHQQEPVSVSAIEENDGTKYVGTDNPQENGPPENRAMEDGGDDDDGKKGKDVKGIRPFKFALAEFVKELLKPTWKEGQVSKEVYKTIVKKTVDKVTDTVKGEHVPQTKERIDQYLSFSKPKLSKLVQAYVKRYQKS